MVRANTVSCAGHRLDVRGHASAIRSHRPTLEGNRLLDQGQLLKRGLGQFFWELELHGQGLHHSLDAVLDASLIDSLVCLEDLRGGAAQAVITIDHVLTIHLKNVLECLENLKAVSQCSLLIALLLLLELGEAVHVEVVIALEELFDKTLKILYKST